jgi:hypothetical protein
MFVKVREAATLSPVNSSAILEIAAGVPEVSRTRIRTK